MFDIARLVGDALREVKTRDGPYLLQNNIDSHATFIVGGQIRGEPPRLFEVYSEGNFIEATADTCYFQIGESKYGKPVIDRVVNARDFAAATRPSARSCRSTRRCARISRSGCRSTSLVYETDRLRLKLQAPDRGIRSLFPDDPHAVGRGPAPRVRRAAEPGLVMRRRTRMAIRVALQHRTTYRVRPPRQFVAARDAAAAGAALPHADPRLLAAASTPARHFLNWQQDPYGN